VPEAHAGGDGFKVKDAFEVMPRPTAEMFLKLQHEPLLQSMVLIGGTALALHLGHRISEDLDYLWPEPKLPKTKLQALFRKLQSQGHTVVDRDNLDAYFDFLNAGMDLHDYSHTVEIDERINVTFFVAEVEQVRVLQAGSPESIAPRLATLEELCALKALVARSRSTSRDWLDLYILEREHGFSLTEWWRTYEKAGLKDWDFENAVRRICSGHVRQDDATYESLMPSAPSVEEIAAHFRVLRAEYEIEKSREGL
jgi:predicted nucleotidyltransferase component of viral defense system